jgi:hypothetical protein
MLIVLVGNAALVVLPALVIALLIRNATSNFTAPRFVLAALLLPPTTVGLAKLLNAPATLPDIRHLPGACAEQVAVLILLLGAGLPGLLYKRRRSFGFFLSLLVLGGGLTALMTVGTVIKEGLVLQVVLPLSAYFALVIFLGAWTHVLRQDQNISPPSEECLRLTTSRWAPACCCLHPPRAAGNAGRAPLG